LTSELRARVGARFTAAFYTPHALFLLAAQERNKGQFREGISLLTQRWKGEIKFMQLANTPLQPTGSAGG
jgi:hypothetical protein